MKASVSIDEVEFMPLRTVQDQKLEQVFTEFSSTQCKCIKCGQTFNPEENTLYSCNGHTGTLELDSFRTTANIAAGVAIGVIAGAAIGVAAGLLVVGHAATAVAGTAAASQAAGLSAAATVFVPGAAAGATAASTGAVVTHAAVVAGGTGAAAGGGAGAAGGTGYSLIPSIGAYKWSCCGGPPDSRKCPGRTSLHRQAPDPVVVEEVREDISDEGASGQEDSDSAGK